MFEDANQISESNCTKIKENKMNSVTIKGFKSVAHAKMFTDWFEGQGEQDQDIWFDENGLDSQVTDIGRKGGYREFDKDGNITMYLK